MCANYICEGLFIELGDSLTFKKNYSLYIRIEFDPSPDASRIVISTARSIEIYEGMIYVQSSQGCIVLNLGHGVPVEIPTSYLTKAQNCEVCCKICSYSLNEGLHLTTEIRNKFR
ncbi:hypothetical protein AVEN_83455-1 [Araneus ventricosus]|uniref:Uncharacterized protein n=1 Tax=Araneus ventricosus TaxID=182803 RepID=A0A4Y2WPS4_ARAVE|nr:hypothetical protein AVEN_101766-1 [Araneus ventricosus]GBO39169.1 hypothetical protein AVEN_260106-1 [Araneus ventricosus]GBO39170.1 hypothetical protein AVEN_66322-1 [Araneus ventricosus]GBO39171.1 hypothetical protein AVEN_83455-1 [Araneus ventricosus]